MLVMESQGEEREDRIRGIAEENRAKNFSKLMTYFDSQFQELPVNSSVIKTNNQ